MRRKLLTPTFHFRILDQFVEVFNRNGSTLVDKLLQKKDATNVHSDITLCTLDIICGKRGSACSGWLSTLEPA